jgi:DNA-binding NarL/FixJ family response regulator
MGIKVFITDDHYMVVEGIRSLLQNEKEVEWLGHASNADSCMAFLQQQLPEVILMDINMPGKSGIDLCKEVKEKYPVIAIIGLSTFSQQSYIQKMMDNGASGYVLKNATKEELMDAIETVAKGRNYYSFDVAQIMNRHQTDEIILTRREHEVLDLIADGLTNNEVAEKLFISSATVDTHRKNLLCKFNAKNIASLIKTAMQLNMI